jgi:hypothetical protein
LKHRVTDGCVFRRHANKKQGAVIDDTAKERIMIASRIIGKADERSGDGSARFQAAVFYASMHMCRVASRAFAVPRASMRWPCQDHERSFRRSEWSIHPSLTGLLRDSFRR